MFQATVLSRILCVCVRVWVHVCVWGVGGWVGEGGEEERGRGGWDNVNKRYEMYPGHVHVLYGYIICVVA